MNNIETENKVTNPDRPKALPFVADGPVYTPGRMAFGDNGNVFKLSSNESAVGIGTKAVEAIIKAAGEQHLYPEADGGPLAHAIGDKFDLDPAQILVGPGSDQIINWIVRGWVGIGDEVVYSAHGFQSYRIRTLMVGGRPVAAPEIELKANFENILMAVTDRTKIVFIANPNNPTGTYIPIDKLKELRLRLRPDVLLVIDEAYCEFVDRPDYRSAVELVNNKDENIVVTRTFSKFYALAGIRAGWAYAPLSMMGPLSRIRGPFSISKIALDAAAAALLDTEHVEKTLAHNNKWQPWLIREIRALGYEVTESVTNFVLFRVPGGVEAAEEFDKKLRDLGFIGRLATQNDLPGWLRLTIGSEKAMVGVVQALKKLKQ